MEAWKTSCPGLPIWEDAQDSGFVTMHQKAGGLVWFEASDKGRMFLNEHGRSPRPTTNRAGPTTSVGPTKPVGPRNPVAQAKTANSGQQPQAAPSPLPSVSPLFETERVFARHLDYPDYDDFYAVYSDAEAMRWVDDGTPIQAEDCFRWIAVTHKNYKTRGYGMSVLVSKATGDIIGFCGLVHPGGQEDVEIKYALKRAFWGRGLATEAVRGMLGYAREAHGIRRVIATVAPANGASTNVLAKAGLRETEIISHDDGSNTAVWVWTDTDS